MADQIKQLSQIKKDFKKDLKALDFDESATKVLSQLEEKYLGKSSKLLSILGNLKEMAAEDKKKIGKAANQLRIELTEDLKKAGDKANAQLLRQQLENEHIDPTHPGITNTDKAAAHIITKTIEQIEDIFRGMGFEIEYSYQIDTPENAFDGVNIPENHPARDSWDTIWLSDGNLGIPHTSAMQNRIIAGNDLPIKKIILGKCFRNEATDATHEHTFHQMEGVYLDRHVTMAEMIGVLLEFLNSFFDAEFKHKFIPDFFPFVEPGGQLAIEKDGEYLEILGCGMVHPEVIRRAGKDPAKISGFAWGVGIERLIILKHGVEDIRHFFSSDLDFIKQFD